MRVRSILSTILVCMLIMTTIPIGAYAANSTYSNLARPVVTASNVAKTGKVKLTWNKVSGADKYEVYRAGYKNGTYKKIGSTTGTTFTNTSATAEYIYYYKVKAISTKNSGIKSTYSTVVSSTCDLARPVITASNVPKTGKVKLTWSKVSGADKYEVYRATSKTGTYKKLGSTTGTSFTNTSASAEALYYYKVKAISTKRSSANSAYSTIVSRRCDLAKPVVTVSNVAKTGKIKLTWDKVKGADKYYVYRSTSKSGEYKYLGYTTGTTYTNTSAVEGKSYYYKVKAISTKSKYANSAYSEIEVRTCDLARPVVTASNIIAPTGEIKLTWDKVSGADKYYVYRSSSKTGEYTYIGSTTGTTYTNTSLTKGKTYYYKVKAIVLDKTAANSAYSTVASCCCHNYEAIYGEVDNGYYDREEYCKICDKKITGIKRSHMKKHIDNGEFDYTVKKNVEKWLPVRDNMNTSNLKIKTTYEVCNFCNKCGKRFLVEEDYELSDHMYDYLIKAAMESDPVKREEMLQNVSYTTKKDYVTRYLAYIDASYCNICGEDITGKESRHIDSYNCAIRYERGSWVSIIESGIVGYKCTGCGKEKAA